MGEVGEAAVSVVIPARNAARTLGRVLESLAAQTPSPHEVIVVDDGSTDGTAEIAERHGARIVRPARAAYAGGARNAGWDAASGDVVVFLDADVIPAPGWGPGLSRALNEFPGAIVGCARTFVAETKWEWIAHFQVETPYLPGGEPREVAFVSSFCMAVPRDAPVRWDETYGGEDALFCADAVAAGIRIVFDPRFTAVHDHKRETFADLRKQQDRLVYGFARFGPQTFDDLRKRLMLRVPLHYFALARLPIIYRRLAPHPELRARFVRLLPLMAFAEWTLGVSALRYAVQRLPARGEPDDRFR